MDFPFLLLTFLLFVTLKTEWNQGLDARYYSCTFGKKAGLTCRRLKTGTNGRTEKTFLRQWFSKSNIFPCDMISIALGIFHIMSPAFRIPRYPVVDTYVPSLHEEKIIRSLCSVFTKWIFFLNSDHAILINLWKQ